MLKKTLLRISWNKVELSMISTLICGLALIALDRIVECECFDDIVYCHHYLGSLKIIEEWC